MTWDNYLNDQLCNEVYATELFIKTTAVLVGINMHITSEHCTRQHPYNIVTSTWNDEETHNANSILIGNISGVHFQSLIGSHSDDLSTAMEISEAEQIINRHYEKEHKIKAKPIHKNLYVSM